MAAPAFRFTMFDLDSCLALPAVIHNNGGRLTTTELAQHLGYKSENNGSFNTRLGNARLFGLVDGTASGLAASKRALAILHPDFPETEMRARLEAFEAVPLYRAVLDQYHGQPLPDTPGMVNALTTRWAITADKAPMVLARMMDSADEAGLFSVAGNRTKMIRPTIAGNSGSGGTPERDDSGGATGNVSAGNGDGGPTKVRANKMIDGVLDQLPEGTWTEAEMRQWLRFFESALRVVYRLPEPMAGGDL
jgi:hypothetical protein